MIFSTQPNTATNTTQWGSTLPFPLDLMTRVVELRNRKAVYWEKEKHSPLKHLFLRMGCEVSLTALSLFSTVEVFVLSLIQPLFSPLYLSKTTSLLPKRFKENAIGCLNTLLFCIESLVFNILDHQLHKRIDSDWLRIHYELRAFKALRDRTDALREKIPKAMS